jgi:hypothetical protein
MDEFADVVAQVATKAIERMEHSKERSRRMIEAVAVDDMIVTVNDARAAQLHVLLREADKAGVHIAVVGLDIGEAMAASVMPGRVFFDHVWQSAMVCNAVSRVRAELLELQRLGTRDGSRAAPAEDPGQPAARGEWVEF